MTAIDSTASLLKPGSVGHAVGSAVIKIIDADGKACAPGEIATI